MGSDTGYEGGGEGSEVVPMPVDEAIDPLSLWSSLPQPHGHMVISEAAGLKAGVL